MSIEIKTIAMPISERQKTQVEGNVICVNTSYRNIVNYVTGNVQNVVPGENLPLVFSSETTICDLYDKKEYKFTYLLIIMFPYHFREGII